MLRIGDNMSTNDLMEEFEAEVIDLLNAATKEAFIAGYKQGWYEIDPETFKDDLDFNLGNLERVYQEWVKDNE